MRYIPVLSYCCQSPPPPLALLPVALFLCLHPQDQDKEHDEKEFENDFENAEKGDGKIGMKEGDDNNNLFTLASVHSRIIL